MEIPKDYHGDDCWQCEDLINAGVKETDVEKAHDNCHGWFHCGEECCGGCGTCGI